MRPLTRRLISCLMKSVNVVMEDLPEKEQVVARANYLHTGSLQVNSLDQADGEDGPATVLADEQRAQLEGAETNQQLTYPLLRAGCTVTYCGSSPPPAAYGGGTAGTGSPSYL